jgi:hypothetical protein
MIIRIIITGAVNIKDIIQAKINFITVIVALMAISNTIDIKILKCGRDSDKVHQILKIKDYINHI